MGKLYIMCGLPFAGKTTLAKAIVSKLGFAYISLDDISREQTNSARQPERSWEEACWRINKRLAEGQSVVYDATNHTKEERDLLRTLAFIRQVAAKVIFVYVPQYEARRRWREVGPGYSRSEEEFGRVAEHFQSPLGEEDVVQFNQAPLEEWLNHNFPG